MYRLHVPKNIRRQQKLLLVEKGLMKTHFPRCDTFVNKMSLHKLPLKKKDPKLVFKTDYCLMQVKSIADAPREHSAILFTFIKLPFVFKTFVLSIFEWLLKTGFTVFFMFFHKKCCSGASVRRAYAVYYVQK